MSKSAFAQTIIGKMKSAIGTDGQSFSENSATAAMQAVADGITEYLVANTVVSISYKGLIPGTPPVTDPVVSDTFKIIGSCATTGPANSFDDWIKKIEANIIAGFSLAAKGDNGVVFAQTPFAINGIKTTQSALKSAHSVDDKNPQQKIWEIICDGIIKWINSTAKNKLPGSASNPTASSTGTANIVKITLE